MDVSLTSYGMATTIIRIQYIIIVGIMIIADIMVHPAAITIDIMVQHAITMFVKY